MACNSNYMCFQLLPSIAPSKKDAISSHIKKLCVHLNTIQPIPLKSALVAPNISLMPTTLSASEAPNADIPLEMPREAAPLSKLKLFMDHANECSNRPSLPRTFVDLNMIFPLFQDVRCSDMAIIKMLYLNFGYSETPATTVNLECTLLSQHRTHLC